MTHDAAQLSSVATALEELTARVLAVAERREAGAGTTGRDDAVAADLYEVERALRAASRRLAMVLDRLEGLR
jgi:hypothetical protein